ncbi:ASIC-2 protein [Aphelenchoides avenae]|nr:ASIC-2 protein [Aphelenchus avenae]
MGFITLWKNYLAWTQAVVVAPLIASARRRLTEVAWFVVFVSTTVAFVVQCGYLVEDHLSYKKSTNIRLIYEPAAPFPAVTFCNLNPFKKSMVEHSQELTNLLAAYTYVSKVNQAHRKSGTASGGNDYDDWHRTS